MALCSYGTYVVSSRRSASTTPASAAVTQPAAIRVRDAISNSMVIPRRTIAHQSATLASHFEVIGNLKSRRVELEGQRMRVKEFLTHARYDGKREISKRHAKRLAEFFSAPV